METSLSRFERVFLVEDSKLILDRLSGMLGEIDGVEIIGSADTAAAATQAILDGHPDTVVLDLRLAAGSGLDVLRAVHPQAPDINFIVLTNFATPQYRDICLNAGARHFIDKSCEIGKVRQIIADLAGRRSNH